jgi:microsomal dipeptidase-like Zn-dependent dipeptidase
MHLQDVGFNEPSAGWPDFDKYPSYNITLHQSMYSDWLYRAFLGGLRLIVAHAVNNEMLCELSFKARVSGGDSICNDVAAVDRQISDARAMEQYLNAQCKSANPPRCLSPNKGWFHIVTSPQEARSTINGGQLAVVLGIEVDRLFGCRESTPGSSDPRNHDCSQDDAATESYITQQVQNYYNLGVRHVFIAHLADSAFAGMAIYNSGQFFPWSLNNLYVNGVDFKTEACMQSGYGFNYNQSLGVLNPSNFPWNLLKDMGLNPPVAGNYPTPTCNARGLQPLGRFLVNALRQKGIMVDMDHLSLETWAGANGLETQLTVVTEQDRRPYYYPIIAGHTGPNALAEGQASERGLNDEQLTFLRRSYGLPSIGIEAGSASSHASYLSAENTYVQNNCDSSTASFAQGYLYFVDSMGNPPTAAVGIASDQSLNKLIAPRFNLPSDPHSPWHTPNYGNGCDGNQAQAQVQTNQISFVQGPPLASNQPPSYYFSAVAGAGTNPPRIFLWTGERDYQLNPHRMWDFNADGLAHLGLYPEFIQDLQNLGVPLQEVAPLYNSAERYISAWQAYGSFGNPDQSPTYKLGVIDPLVCSAPEAQVVCGKEKVCLQAGALCPGSNTCPNGQAMTMCGDTPPIKWCGTPATSTSPPPCPTCGSGETLVGGKCVKGSPK